jgi:cytochrome c-type biogenesis protein CcsB
MAALIFKRTPIDAAGALDRGAAAVMTPRQGSCCAGWSPIRWESGMPRCPTFMNPWFFCLDRGVIYLFVEFKYKNALIGAFVTPIAFLAMAYASMSPNISDRIQPLVPALKSNWLIAHVATCFFGYAAFAIAFGMSIMYLVKARNPEKVEGIIGHLPKLDVLDELTHRMVLFGFLFLTGGIITGSVWANSAWGSYWSWDPKETWSLITWFVYATLLHARLMRGWAGKQIAYLSILGFSAVLFTYFGVNLLPGLHSYGKV